VIAALIAWFPMSAPRQSLTAATVYFDPTLPLDKWDQTGRYETEGACRDALKLDRRLSTLDGGEDESWTRLTEAKRCIREDDPAPALQTKPTTSGLKSDH